MRHWLNLLSGLIAVSLCLNSYWLYFVRVILVKKKGPVKEWHLLKAEIHFQKAIEKYHLIHADHSAQFYNYLNLFMPDWKKRKERLEKYAN